MLASHIRQTLLSIVFYILLGITVSLTIVSLVALNPYYPFKAALWAYNTITGNDIDAELYHSSGWKLHLSGLEIGENAVSDVWVGFNVGKAFGNFGINVNASVDTLKIVKPPNQAKSKKPLKIDLKPLKWVNSLSVAVGNVYFNGKKILNAKTTAKATIKRNIDGFYVDIFGLDNAFENRCTLDPSNIVFSCNLKVNMPNLDTREISELEDGIHIATKNIASNVYFSGYFDERIFISNAYGVFEIDNLALLKGVNSLGIEGFKSNFDSSDESITALAEYSLNGINASSSVEYSGQKFEVITRIPEFTKGDIAELSGLLNGVYTHPKLASINSTIQKTMAKFIKNATFKNATIRVTRRNGVDFEVSSEIRDAKLLDGNKRILFKNGSLSANPKRILISSPKVKSQYATLRNTSVQITPQKTPNLVINSNFTTSTDQIPELYKHVPKEYVKSQVAGQITASTNFKDITKNIKASGKLKVMGLSNGFYRGNIIINHTLSTQNGIKINAEIGRTNMKNFDIIVAGNNDLTNFNIAVPQANFEAKVKKNGSTNGPTNGSTIGGNLRLKSDVLKLATQDKKGVKNIEIIGKINEIDYPKIMALYTKMKPEIEKIKAFYKTDKPSPKELDIDLSISQIKLYNGMKIDNLALDFNSKDTSLLVTSDTNYVKYNHEDARFDEDVVLQIENLGQILRGVKVDKITATEVSYLGNFTENGFGGILDIEDLGVKTSKPDEEDKWLDFYSSSNPVKYENGKVVLDKYKMKNFVHTIDVNGDINLETKLLDLSAFYTTTALDNVGNFVLFRPLFKVLSIGSDGRIASIRVDIKGDVKSPEIHYGTSNILFLKFPYFR